MEYKPNFQPQTKLEQSLTKEQQEQIRNIENIKMGSMDKLSLLLLVLDQKKVADISTLGLHVENQSEALWLAQASEERLEPVIKMCVDMGLVAKGEKYQNKNNGKFSGGYQILISKKAELIQRFQDAKLSGDHGEMGALFGFPDTAIDSFGREGEEGKILDRKEMQNEIERENLGGFINFMPSEKHWKQELVFVKKNMELIKKYSPKIFKEIVGSVR